MKAPAMALVLAVLSTIPTCALGEPAWFSWVGEHSWTKYLATRDTPIVDWTGGLINEDWKANWIRVAKYILYCAPYEGDSVDKVKQAWYGSLVLQGHVPSNGAPAKFGEVNWSWGRWDYTLAATLGGELVSERDYAESILEDEYDPGKSRGGKVVDEWGNEHLWGCIRNGEYWLPQEWQYIKLSGQDLKSQVEGSLGTPFANADEAKGKLMGNPMFQAAVRLAYWVATHIPYTGFTNWPGLGYYDCMSCCYYHGPAAVLLYPDEGWNCVDHAVLTVALYRAAGIPGYVVGGYAGDDPKESIWKENHSWTAVFVYDPNSGKWHEIFIDPVEPDAHKAFKIHSPESDDEYSKLMEYVKSDLERLKDVLWWDQWVLGSIMTNHGTLYVAKPYGYGGKNDPWFVRILCRIEEPWRMYKHRSEFSFKYWIDRVSNFVNKTGHGEWSVDLQAINSLWEALKKNWREIPVREREESPLSPLVITAALLVLLSRRRRPAGTRELGTLITVLVPLLSVLVLVSPGLAIPTEEVTLKWVWENNDDWVNWTWALDDGWEYPWVFPGGGLVLASKRGGGSVRVLPPDKKEFQVGRLLLVAPLWREDAHYRVFLASYKIGELPLPPQAEVHRVLVPSEVKGIVIEGPWRKVQYSLNESESGEWSVLKPSGDSEVFVVEAGLPVRDEWVRLVLPSGSWLLALGWSRDFNVLTLDGKVLFQGRAPYDEVEFERGPVRLVFWYAWYLLNLSDEDDDQVKVEIASPDWVNEHWDKWIEFGANVDFVFDPSAQYDERAFYGPCTLLRLDAKTPVILEFRTPRPGAEAFDYVGESEDDARGFYSYEYFEKHHEWVPPTHPFGNPLTPAWLLLPLLARHRVKRRASHGPHRSTRA